jgi:hypothetical protein
MYDRSWQVTSGLIVKTLRRDVLAVDPHLFRFNQFLIQHGGGMGPSPVGDADRHRRQGAPHAN